MLCYHVTVTIKQTFHPLVFASSISRHCLHWKGCISSRCNSCRSWHTLSLLFPKIGDICCCRICNWPNLISWLELSDSVIISFHNLWVSSPFHPSSNHFILQRIALHLWLFFKVLSRFRFRINYLPCTVSDVLKNATNAIVLTTPFRPLILAWF